jgi:hypothetical protein
VSSRARRAVGQLLHTPSADVVHAVRYVPGLHIVTVHGLGCAVPPAQKLLAVHALQTPSDVAVHCALRYSPAGHVVVHAVFVVPASQK